MALDGGHLGFKINTKIRHLEEDHPIKNTRKASFEMCSIGFREEVLKYFSYKALPPPYVTEPIGFEINYQ